MMHVRLFHNGVVVNKIKLSVSRVGLGIVVANCHVTD